MKLERAMADLSIQLEVKRRLGKNREADALKLGIEAMNAILNWRLTNSPRSIMLLPGETED